ncbi:hypothetical protein FB451DRAFT_1270707 [Mycena latifolia]|nr:hypothetical protein FB451DRAFT_1270707 [Mycena latifolia]
MYAHIEVAASSRRLWLLVSQFALSSSVSIPFLLMPKMASPGEITDSIDALCTVRPRRCALPHSASLLPRFKLARLWPLSRP